MAIRVEAGNDNAIMDYIVQSQRIPLTCNRNRDNTPMLGEFSMSVADVCPLSLRDEGVLIDVYVSGTTYPMFTGEIIKSEKDYNSGSYDLLVRDLLYRLTEKVVSQANLKTLIEAGAGTVKYWVQEETNGFESVQAIYLIERMFDDVGLLYNESGTGFETSPVATVDGNTIQVQHLRIDEFMLYSINQDAAIVGAGSIKYDKNRITYWDFIRSFLSMKFAFNSLYLSLNQSGFSEYYEIDTIPSTPALGDNDVYSFTQKKIVNEKMGWNITHKFDDNRNNYRGISAEYPFNREIDFSGGEGRRSLRVFNNLVFMYHKHWATGNQIIWGSSTDLGAYDNGECMNATTMTYNRQQTRDNDWNIENKEIKLRQREGWYKHVNALFGSQRLEVISEGIV